MKSIYILHIPGSKTLMVFCVLLLAAQTHISAQLSVISAGISYKSPTLTNKEKKDWMRNYSKERLQDIPVYLTTSFEKSISYEMELLRYDTCSWDYDGFVVEFNRNHANAGYNGKDSHFQFNFANNNFLFGYKGGKRMGKSRVSRYNHYVDFGVGVAVEEWRITSQQDLKFKEEIRSLSTWLLLGYHYDIEITDRLAVSFALKSNHLLSVFKGWDLGSESPNIFLNGGLKLKYSLN